MLSQQDAHDDLQFYPSPEALVKRAWATFKNRRFIRVLEPSAGEGDLATEPTVDRHEYSVRGRGYDVDCIELDMSKHPLLREKGFSVVGLDFLSYRSGAIYSHIVIRLCARYPALLVPGGIARRL